MSRILVTGHNGYIGTVMTPVLLAAGHEVVGLDTDYYRRCTFLDRMPQVPAIEKDVRDVTAADLQGFDAVIHLAALSNDPLGDLNIDLTYDINYHSSVNLARMARQAGVGRFLFASSCGLYGAAGDDILTEESPFNPVTAYGRSKVLSEQEIGRLADADFSPTFLRNATAYGVSPRHRFDLVLNNLVAWAITTGRVLIKSDGTPWRPIVHIEDISAAFLAVLEASRPVVHNQAFNVGESSENYRISELAAIVEELVPHCAVEYAADAHSDKRNYRVDFSKIATTLPSFRTKWTARKGVEQLYDEYRHRDLRVEEFEGVKYRRVDHVKMLIDKQLLDQSLRWRHAKPVQ
jgi:nucleoside-diphosphate-sugar epimerase